MAKLPEDRAAEAFVDALADSRTINSALANKILDAGYANATVAWETWLFVVYYIYNHAARFRAGDIVRNKHDQYVVEHCAAIAEMLDKEYGVYQKDNGQMVFESMEEW
jgi:hypothetical protein